MLISVVIPVHDEKKNLHFLYSELKNVLEKKNLNYEIIFVDNGSHDGSIGVLNSFKSNNRVKTIILKKTDKSAALRKGFSAANGDYIVQMDADMQDDPSYIPLFIEKLRTGQGDVIVGWRKLRRDSKGKILLSNVFNMFVNLVSKTKLHDHNCGLKVYKKEAAKSLNMGRGMHRYITILTQRNGFSVSEIKIIHRKRLHGKSKYGLKRIFEAAYDYLELILS